MVKVTELDFMKGYIRMANDGWDWKFHERNGGNLTYRMKKEEVEAAKEAFHFDGPWVDLGVTAANLAGEYFVATGSGKFFRNVILNPEDSLCIARLNEKGDAYQVVWGLVNGGRPTSEFPSHVMNHSVKVARDPAYRVIYHAHPANVIALTFVLPMNDKDFTLALWESMTECPVIFPEGVGVVPWMVPGGADIAMATSELMKKYDVAIWAHHGLFCAGPDFDITFGLMHTVEKAAEIRMKVLSSGLPVQQTITADDFRAIAKDFKLNLNEEFLK